MSERTVEDALAHAEEARAFKPESLRETSRDLIALADEIARLRPVVEACVRFRLAKRAINQFWEDTIDSLGTGLEVYPFAAEVSESRAAAMAVLDSLILEREKQNTDQGK